MAEKMAEWPIRIGGVYRSKGLSMCFRRVTEIAGGRVYFRHFVDKEDEAATDGDCMVRTFTSVCAPEDQSPIPALVEALKSFIALNTDWDHKRFMDAVIVARTVLAKAGAI